MKVEGQGSEGRLKGREKKEREIEVEGNWVL